ncbi:ribosomal protein S18-alanine N-acetyltransferase [Desulfovibrionales bacterium]
MLHDVRVLKPQDALALHALEQSIITDAWSAERLEFLLAEPRFLGLGAFLGSALHGSVTAYTIGGEAEIVNVAVHAAWRRQGLGMALLSRLQDVAIETGLERIVLEVRSSNIQAQGLYAKLGFVHVALRPRYYMYPSEDALVLAWNPAQAESVR